MPIFIACSQNPSACLGAKNMEEYGSNKIYKALMEESTSSLERCKDKHTGPLCGACLKGYWRDSDYNCQICETVLVSNLIFALVIFIMFVGISLVIYATLNDRGKESSIDTQIFQICFNHAVIMSVSINIPYRWPVEMAFLLRFYQTLSGFFFAEGGFSTDCIMEGSIPASYNNALLFACIIPGIFIATWVCVCVGKCFKNKLGNPDLKKTKAYIDFDVKHQELTL